MSYEKVLSQLESMTDKRLIEGQYCNENGCMCAVGASAPEWAKSLNVWVNGMLIGSIRIDLIDPLLEQTGMTLEEAVALQTVNDSFLGPPGDRYNHVLDWLRR